MLFEFVCCEDDGEGHIGTVCELGRHGSTYSPEKTVVVNWDSGNRSNYRVGYQDQFDLIIVDNAQIGKTDICRSCGQLNTITFSFARNIGHRCTASEHYM